MNALLSNLPAMVAVIGIALLAVETTVRGKRGP